MKRAFRARFQQLTAKRVEGKDDREIVLVKRVFHECDDAGR
jgi:hypothetical protein